MELSTSALAWVEDLPPAARIAVAVAAVDAVESVALRLYHEQVSRSSAVTGDKPLAAYVAEVLATSLPPHDTTAIFQATRAALQLNYAAASVGIHMTLLSQLLGVDPTLRIGPPELAELSARLTALTPYIPGAKSIAVFVSAAQVAAEAATAAQLQASATAAQQWLCPLCQVPNTSSDCALCSTPRPVAPPPGAVATTSGIQITGWLCPTCAEQNGAADTICHLCSTSRPALVVAPSAPVATAPTGATRRPSAPASAVPVMVTLPAFNCQAGAVATYVEFGRSVLALLGCSARWLQEHMTKLGIRPGMRACIPHIADMFPACDQIAGVVAAIAGQLSSSTQRVETWDTAVADISALVEWTSLNWKGAPEYRVSNIREALQSLCTVVGPTQACWPKLVSAFLSIVSAESGTTDTVQTIRWSMRTPNLCAALLHVLGQDIAKRVAVICTFLVRMFGPHTSSSLAFTADATEFANVMLSCITGSHTDSAVNAVLVLDAYVATGGSVLALLAQRVAEPLISLVHARVVSRAELLGTNPDSVWPFAAAGMRVLTAMAVHDASLGDRYRVRSSDSILSAAAGCLQLQVASNAVELVAALALGEIVLRSSNPRTATGTPITKNVMVTEETKQDRNMNWNVDFVRSKEVFSCLSSFCIAPRVNLDAAHMAILFRLFRVIVGDVGPPAHVLKVEANVRLVYEPPSIRCLVTQVQPIHAAPIGSCLLPARSLFKKRHVLQFHSAQVPAGFAQFGHVAYLQDELQDHSHGFALVVALSSVGGADSSDPLVAHPTQFKLASTIVGHGSAATLHVWEPVPPVGYVALGVAVTTQQAAPALTDIVCVQSCLTTASVSVQSVCQMADGRHLWQAADATRALRLSPSAPGLVWPTRDGLARRLSTIDPYYSVVVPPITERALNVACTAQDCRPAAEEALRLADCMCSRFVDIEKNWTGACPDIGNLFRAAYLCDAPCLSAYAAIRAKWNRRPATDIPAIHDGMTVLKTAVVRPLTLHLGDLVHVQEALRVLYSLVVESPADRSPFPADMCADVLQAVLPVMQLAAGEPDIQLHGSIIAAAACVHVTPELRLLARTAVKRAVHLFENMADRQSDFHRLNGALAVTKSGACVIQ